MRTGRIRRRLQEVLAEVPVEMRIKRENKEVWVEFTASDDRLFTLWRIIQEDEMLPTDHPQATHYAECSGFMSEHSKMLCTGVCQIEWTVACHDAVYTVMQAMAIKQASFVPSTREPHSYCFRTRTVRVQLNQEWLTPGDLACVAMFFESLLGVNSAAAVGVRDAWDGLSA